MASLNKVQLIGYLGADPEALRYTGNGDAILNINLGTTQRWKNEAGEKQERTDWHKLSLYRKSAEILNEYGKKGSLIYVEGQLRTRSYEDRDDGKKRYVTEVIVSELQLLDRKPGGKSVDVEDDSADGPGHESDEEFVEEKPAKNAKGKKA